MADTASVQSLDRAFHLLELLSLYPKGMQLTDICKQSGLHKSTAHRLLMALVSLGYVCKDADNNRYRLTLKIMELSGRISESVDVVSVAKGPLNRLRDATQEACHLVIQEGIELVYVYKADSLSGAIQMVSKIGMRRPLYCTGVGKALLAGMSNGEIARIWAESEIVQYTPYTCTDLDQFLQELETVRARGYALDRQENELGVNCIATALHDYTGRAVAAISMSAPVMRIDEEKLHEMAPAVLGTAAEISTALGYHPRG